MNDLHDILFEYFFRFYPAFLMDEEAFEGLRDLVHALLVAELRREKRRLYDRLQKVSLS